MRFMEKDNPRKLNVEVAYANEGQVHIFSTQAVQGDTVQEVLNRSGILRECPEIDLQKNKVGIFSKICELETIVNKDCRIEIYRPLLVDPKEARRKRAAVK